jgi:hypothetical protein
MKYLLLLLVSLTLQADNADLLKIQLEVEQIRQTMEESRYFIGIVKIENYAGTEIDGPADDRGPLQITPDFYKDAVAQLRKEGKPVPTSTDLYRLAPSKIIALAYYRRYKLVSPYNRARAHNNGPSYRGASDYALRVLNIMRDLR